MSLSDDEKRILSEMESQLAESDPRLVDDVSSTTVYTAGLRNVKWAILLFIAGVAFMIATLMLHFILAAVGFLIMMVALLVLERNLTRLGKTGISQIMQSTKNKGAVGGYVKTVRANMQKRFGKEKG